MHSHELTTGRTFGVRFDPGESFFPALEDFCRDNGIRHGYIPMFLAAFAEADVVGTCDKLDDPAAPVWSKVHLTNAEALGSPRAQRAFSDRLHPPPACRTRPVPGRAAHAGTGCADREAPGRLRRAGGSGPP